MQNLSQPSCTVRNAVGLARGAPGSASNLLIAGMSVSTASPACDGFGDQSRQPVIGLRADDDVDHRARGASTSRPRPARRSPRRAIIGFEPSSRRQPADIRIGLLGGLLADVAGVEHHEVGLVAFSGRGHALPAEQFGHPLAVIDVHLAAEAFDFEGLGKSFGLAYRRAGQRREAELFGDGLLGFGVSCLRSPLGRGARAGGR